MKKYILSIVMIALLSCGSKENETAAVADEEIQETEVVLNAEQMKNAAIEVGLPTEINMHSTIQVNGIRLRQSTIFIIGKSCIKFLSVL